MATTPATPAPAATAATHAAATPAPPTPRPPAPTHSSPPPPTGDARALLGQGALPDAARAFAHSLAAGARDRYSLQLLTACSPETVQKAAGAGGPDLFIVPVTLQGRSCYRVCFGLYGSRQAAEAAIASVPAYFRQGGARPRLSTLAELLP